MENQDLLLRQIESLGLFFRKIFSKVLLLKESAATDIKVAEVGDLLKSGIGMSLDEIALLTNEGFLARLSAQKLTSADLSNMINLLVDLAAIKAASSTGYNSNQLLSKALFIGDYLAEHQKMVYFGNTAALDEARRLAQ